MGRELADNFPVARAVFDEADKALGFSISKMCFRGSEEATKADRKHAARDSDLFPWRFIACWRKRASLPTSWLVTALANILRWLPPAHWSFPTPFKLVRKRGEYMQEAVPAGEGAMAAIMGFVTRRCADICKKAAEGASLFAREFEFARTDRDFWKCRRR